MPDFVDYYKTLQVTPQASERVIKMAYKALVLENHPDGHPENKRAEEQTKLINEAFFVLSDNQKRSIYDKVYTSYYSSQKATQEKASSSTPKPSQKQSPNPPQAKPKKKTSGNSNNWKASIVFLALILVYSVAMSIRNGEYEENMRNKVYQNKNAISTDTAQGIAGVTSEPNGAEVITQPDEIPPETNAIFYNPSFDCNNQLSDSEMVVCTNPYLSYLDRTMSENFKKLLFDKNYPIKLLQDSQLQWLSSRDSCINESVPDKCMESQYKLRIDELLSYQKTKNQANSPPPLEVSTLLPPPQEVQPLKVTKPTEKISKESLNSPNVNQQNEYNSVPQSSEESYLSKYSN